jgi:predicted ATPase
MKIDKIDIDKNLIADCKKIIYANIVFYTPIWEKIYIKDTERKEDIISAIKIEEILLSCYKSFGYTLIEIPKLAITQRVDFILSKT